MKPPRHERGGRLTFAAEMRADEVAPTRCSRAVEDIRPPRASSFGSKCSPECTKTRRDETERFLSLFEWLHVDEEVSRVGAALAALYRRSHSGIGDVDYSIAATALEHDADLLTTNVRHFPMLAGDSRRAY